MPGIGELGQLTKAYGFPIAVLLCVILAMAYVIRVLWTENQKLHALQKELLDQRGKFLDSILSEAINEKNSKRVS